MVLSDGSLSRYWEPKQSRGGAGTQALQPPRVCTGRKLGQGWDPGDVGVAIRDVGVAIGHCTCARNVPHRPRVCSARLSSTAHVFPVAKSKITFHLLQTRHPEAMCSCLVLLPGPLALFLFKQSPLSPKCKCPRAQRGVLEIGTRGQALGRRWH